MPDYIYALSDPRTNDLRYVGWTGDPDRRLRDHIRLAKAGNRSHRSSWIRQLFSEGLEPRLEVLEIDPPDGRVQAERDWISVARDAGFQLTNHTDGGDGISGYRHSDEARQRISAAGTGRVYGPISEERRRKLSAAHLGRKQNPEVVQRRTALNIGKKRTIEQRARIAASIKAWHRANPGKKRTPEQRARISESIKTWHQSRKCDD